MSSRTLWVLGAVCALSLGLLLVSGQMGASLWHRSSAPPVGSALPSPFEARTEATTSPDRQSPAGSGWAPALDPSDNPDPKADLTLGKDQREYLWQVEHHGLVLSRLGFSRIAKALKDDDPKAFLSLCAEGFAGEVPGHPREVRFEHDATRLLRQRDSGQPSVRLDRQAMILRLFEDRRRFTGRPNVKLALMGLAPVDYKDLDGIWQGTCQLRMSGEMGAGRPGEVVLYLQYRLPRPTEELLKSDGWLRSCAITQRQVAEAPRFLMHEVAARRGIDVKPFHDNWSTPEDTQIVSGGVNLCDYNRDGCLDMLVTDVATNVLYQGQPDGTFADVTSQVRLPQIPTMITATFVDLDGDGWEDLIYGSLLLRNHEGRYFAPVDTPTLSVRPQASVAVADYDRDGKVNLYVTYIGLTKAATWIKGEGGGQVHNRLWRNLGNWKFADVTESSGASGGNRFDLHRDLARRRRGRLARSLRDQRVRRGVLLVNQGNGTFREQLIEDDPGDFGSMGVTAGDFDNDGHIDIYVANMYSKAGNRVMGNLWPGSYPDSILDKLHSFTKGSQLHHNLGGLKFERIGRDLQVADVGWAYGPAMADLNNDGWLDIFATCGFISRSRDDPDG